MLQFVSEDSPESLPDSIRTSYRTPTSCLPYEQYLQLFYQCMSQHITCFIDTREFFNFLPAWKKKLFDSTVDLLFL
jgi:hypothetical protein